MELASAESALVCTKFFSFKLVMLKEAQSREPSSTGSIGADRALGQPGWVCQHSTEPVIALACSGSMRATPLFAGSQSGRGGAISASAAALVRQNRSGRLLN